MLIFRFEERDSVVRRQRTFPLVTNSIQTLKQFDKCTNYLVLRVTNNISLFCCVSSFTIRRVLLEAAVQLEGERPPTCSLLAVAYWINAQSFGVRGAVVLSWERETEQEDSQVCIQVRIPKNRKQIHYKDAEVIHSFHRSAVHCLELFTTEPATKHCCTESKSEVKDLSLRWSSGQWGLLILFSFWFYLTQLIRASVPQQSSCCSLSSNKM